MTTQRTRVVNIRTTPQYDVYIGRAGHGRDGYFGNPFRLEIEADRARVLVRFARYFHDRVFNDLEYASRVQALRGRVLGCFCKPKACHGDIIAAWLDQGALLGEPL